MRIVRAGARAPGGAAPGAAVAIGNFDGFHRGHRAVLDAARSLAAELGWRDAPDVELSSLASRAGRAGAAMLAWAAAGGADLDAWADSIGAAA